MVLWSRLIVADVIYFATITDNAVNQAVNAEILILTALDFVNVLNKDIVSNDGIHANSGGEAALDGL